MTIRPALLLLALALLAGCPGGGIREGFFPCNTVRDCPTDWFCRADAHCWSTPDPVDAGSDASVSTDAGTDAATSDAAPDAGSSDAARLDVGCMSATETCNATDDDCDGLVDEGLIAVGPAVTVIADPTFDTGFLAGTISGFGVLGYSSATSTAGWVAAGLDGSPSSGVQTSADYFAMVDAVGYQNLLVTSAFGADGSSFVTIDLASPAMPRTAFNVDGTHLVVARFTSFDGTTVTGYVMLFQALGGPATLRRVRANVALASGASLSDTELATDVAHSWAFSATNAGPEDLVAYADTAGGVQLLSAPVGDAAGATQPVGAIDDGDVGVWGVEIAIADPSRAVSSENPLAVVWTRADGDVFFAEVTDTTTFAMRTPRLFTTGVGSGEPRGARSIAMTRIPGSAGMLAHWAVVLLSSDFAASPQFTITAFEVQPGAVRELVVPDELGADRHGVSVARSGGSIRLAERGNAGGIVTRSIGCE